MYVDYCTLVGSAECTYTTRSFVYLRGFMLFRPFAPISPFAPYGCFTPRAQKTMRSARSLNLINTTGRAILHRYGLMFFVLKKVDGIQFRHRITLLCGQQYWLALVCLLVGHTW